MYGILYTCYQEYIYGGFLKWWYPQIIHFNGVFHYKPSILGYPYFWKHPYIHMYVQVPNMWAFQNYFCPVQFLQTAPKRGLSISCDSRQRTWKSRSSRVLPLACEQWPVDRWGFYLVVEPPVWKMLVKMGIFPRWKYNMFETNHLVMYIARHRKGLMIWAYENRWFPLIRPAISGWLLLYRGRKDPGTSCGTPSKKEPHKRNAFLFRLRKQLLKTLMGFCSGGPARICRRHTWNTKGFLTYPWLKQPNGCEASYQPVKKSLQSPWQVVFTSLDVLFRE